MRKEHITLEVQDLLKQYAAHPQVAALNTLLKSKTSRNIFLKGLNGSGAAMTIASLFSKREAPAHQQTLAMRGSLIFLLQNQKENEVRTSNINTWENKGNKGAENNAAGKGNAEANRI